MTVYVNLDEGPSMATLANVLPSPESVLRNGYGLHLLLLLTSVALIRIFLVATPTEKTNISRHMRYLGILFAVLITALSQWIVFRFEWELSTHIGAIFSAITPPDLLLSLFWHKVGKVASFIYFIAVIWSAIYIWQNRFGLGAGVARLAQSAVKANERV